MASRKTVQREIILSELGGMCGHFSADEIHERIHESYPSISRATVYRNLNSLAQEGKVLKIPVSDGADRFEILKKKHYHVMCVRCGRVCDVGVPYMDSIEQLAQQLDVSGFEILGHSLLFEGICDECASHPDDLE